MSPMPPHRPPETLPQGGSDGQGPGAGGGFVSPPAPQGDPRAAQAAETILQIVSLTRRMGLMYPSMTQEARTINDAASRMQAKLLAAHPAPEPMAPPV